MDHLRVSTRVKRVDTATKLLSHVFQHQPGRLHVFFVGAWQKSMTQHDILSRSRVTLLSRSHGTMPILRSRNLQKIVIFERFAKMHKMDEFGVKRSLTCNLCAKQAFLPHFRAFLSPCNLRLQSASSGRLTCRTLLCLSC